MLLPLLLSPLTAWLTVLTLYMAAITVGAWLYRPPAGRGSRQTRIALIVPAHNEGARIRPTLRDLAGCVYPSGSYTVFVVADNCEDDTAAEARAGGAQVLERFDTTLRGKGQALDWALRTRRDELATYDVIVFVDADMFIDPQFLAAIDDAFQRADVQVVQSRYTIANPTDSWLAAFGFMSFGYVNHVRPAGRCFWGGSCGLKGSGMAFRSALILRTGWPAWSIAEDQEFGKTLLLEGTRIHYLPTAVVTSNIAPQLRQVHVQQARWEGGKHEVDKRFLPKFLRAMLHRPRIMILDELVDLIVPPLTLTGALLVVSALLAWFTGALPLGLVGACALVFAAAVVTGLVQLRAPPRALGYLAMAPFFVAMKLLVFAKLAVSSRPAQWNRTPRDGE